MGRTGSLCLGGAAVAITAFFVIAAACTTVGGAGRNLRPTTKPSVGSSVVKVDTQRNVIELFQNFEFGGTHLVVWPVTQFVQEQPYELPRELGRLSSLRWNLPKDVEVDLFEQEQGEVHITLQEGEGQIPSLADKRWDFNDRARFWRWRYVGRHPPATEPTITGAMVPKDRPKRPLPPRKFEGNTKLLAKAIIAATIWTIIKGRFTPVTFLLGIVIDWGTGKIVDYALELKVMCDSCGARFDVHPLCDEIANLICPDCGRGGGQVDAEVKGRRLKAH